MATVLHWSRSTTRGGRPGRRSSGRTAGLPAALWVERNEPAVAAATRWFLATWEFLAYRLTGVAATSLVAGQAYPSTDVLAAAGIDPRRVPPPLLAGEVVGGLTDT